MSGNSLFDTRPWPTAQRLIEVAGAAEALSAAIRRGLLTTDPCCAARLPGFVPNAQGVSEAFNGLALALYDEPPGLKAWLQEHAESATVTYAWPYKWHHSIVQPFTGIWNIFKGFWRTLPKTGVSNPQDHPLWRVCNQEDWWSQSAGINVFFLSIDRVPSLSCWQRGRTGFARSLEEIHESPPPERMEAGPDGRLIRADDGIPVEWLTALETYAEELRKAVIAIVQREPGSEVTLPYDPELLKAWTEQFRQAWRKAESTQFLIYQRLFPWFLKDLMEVGWSDDPHSSSVGEVFQRAHREWTELTALRPLCDMRAWREASAAAGFAPAAWNELQWKEVGDAIAAWAVAIRAEKERRTRATADRAGQPADTAKPTGPEGIDKDHLSLEHEDPKQPVRNQVFISYSHKDKRWLNDLQKHLKPYSRDCPITAWSDQQIEPGSKWFSDIQAALARTSVAVLLVTSSFVESDFIHEHELTPILKEAEHGGVRILWIPVEACAFTKTPLKDYQAVIDPENPLERMSKPNRNKAWVRICEVIEKAVKEQCEKSD